jgi:hypothetical protein
MRVAAKKTTRNDQKRQEIYQKRPEMYNKRPKNDKKRRKKVLFFQFLIFDTSFF